MSRGTQELLVIWLGSRCSIRSEFLGRGFFNRYSTIQRETFSTHRLSHSVSTLTYNWKWSCADASQEFFFFFLTNYWSVAASATWWSNQPGSRVEKLLKIKVRWEPKLILGVRQFLPKSWNSLSLSNEEFTSSFRHTWSTSDWLLLCIFFFQFKLKLVSQWVSEWVSSHVQCGYWTPRKVWFVLIYYFFVWLIFFSVFNTFHFLTIFYFQNSAPVSSSLSNCWKCEFLLEMYEVSIQSNHMKAPFAICITVFVASRIANG